MDDELTIAEIESRFDSEWVLVGGPRTNDALGVRGGKVLYHSKDRDQSDRKVLELSPGRFAVLYTGKTSEGMEFVP